MCSSDLIAMPGGMLLDMSTSASSRGKINVARAAGQSLPPGIALDRDGRPTADPNEVETLTPMAGPKGAGLSLMIECLTSLALGNPLIASALNDNKLMKNHHGGMVVLDGHVYGFDEGVLRCLNLKTGESVWQDRSVGKGSLTFADGHLYLRSENGPMALCTATTKGYEEKGRFEPKNRSDKPAWAHPVVCGGRLFVRDMDSLDRKSTRLNSSH